MPRKNDRQRGSTLIEVMISSLIVAIAMTGLARVVVMAVTSNRAAQHSTLLGLVGLSTLESEAVANKLAPSRWAQAAGALTPTPTPDSATGFVPPMWAVDGCFDIQGLLLADNLAGAPNFACPDGTFYRRGSLWVPISDSAISQVLFGPSVPSGNQRWKVYSYAEELDPSNPATHACTASTRFSTRDCKVFSSTLTY